MDEKRNEAEPIRLTWEEWKAGRRSARRCAGLGLTLRHAAAIARRIAVLGRRLAASVRHLSPDFSAGEIAYAGEGER